MVWNTYTSAQMQDIRSLNSLQDSYPSVSLTLSVGAPGFTDHYQQTQRKSQIGSLRLDWKQGGLSTGKEIAIAKVFRKLTSFRHGRR
eukprot:c28324_g1_i1 orf=77-337(+)